MRRIFSVSLACALLFTAGQAASPLDDTPTRVSEKRPEVVLKQFLGMPYRKDGTLNDRQLYTTFNDPETVFATPGLNCSGLVLAASRKILDKAIPIKDAVRDRLNDSGPESPLGHDWDFGFDLILNIAEGTPHTLLLPGGSRMPDILTGRNVPGFDPHAAHFSDYLLPRMKEGSFYLVSFSKHKTPESPALLHYHTGIMVREGDAVWSYSTTHTSKKTIRLNVASPEGLATFRHSFRNARNSYKRLTIIEVTPR